MTAESVITLIAVLPLIGALVCRLDDASDHRARFSWSALVNVVLMCGAGKVALQVLSAPPSPAAWLVVTCGWAWILATWLRRQLREVERIIDSPDA